MLNWSELTDVSYYRYESNFQNLKIKNFKDNIMSFRGEIGIIIINNGTETAWIEDGERVAQMVIAPVVQCEFEEVASKNDLDDTERGDGGFGHTGKF